MARGGVEDTRLEAKDTKKFRGQIQGQTLSRPRTQTQAFSKKKVFKIFFQAISKKKVFKKFFLGEKGLQNFFSGDLYSRKPKKRCLQIFRKASGFFQRNFNGSKIVLSSSQGQGNFRGLEASRPRPRSSKCVLEAKDVLGDSTSAFVFAFDEILLKNQLIFSYSLTKFQGKSPTEMLQFSPTTLLQKLLYRKFICFAVWLLLFLFRLHVLKDRFLP